MLTVACVWVNANVPYTVEYVTKLHAMCQRWITRPFRLICLTDRPWLIPDPIERGHIQLPKGMKGWWAKVEAFNANRRLGPRVLYLDLDTLIVGSLDAIIDFPAPFALVPHAGTFNGKDGLAVVKRFNSSVMVFDAAVTYRLYDDWTPSVTERLWGDQDWYGEQMPHAVAMPLEWFPRISELQERGPSPDAKVVLAKTPKNAEAAKRWPWARQAWEAAA